MRELSSCSLVESVFNIFWTPFLRLRISVFIQIEWIHFRVRLVWCQFIHDETNFLQEFFGCYGVLKNAQFGNCCGCINLKFLMLVERLTLSFLLIQLNFELILSDGLPSGLVRHFRFESSVDKVWLVGCLSLACKGLALRRNFDFTFELYIFKRLWGRHVRKWILPWLLQHFAF